MTVGTYEKINEYSSVRISLSSAENIRSKSYGEVKKTGNNKLSYISCRERWTIL